MRADADAVMAGARTVDSAPGHYGPGPDKYRRMRLRKGLPEFNLRVIVSGAASVSPRADIFRYRFGPIIVIASGSAPERNLRRLRGVADDVEVFGGRELDFPAALRWLRERWNVRRVLCEGGGELNAALLRRGLVDQIYLTVCPLIFGGRNAPTLADGQSVESVDQAIRLRMESAKRVGDEMYLVYRVKNPRVPRKRQEKSPFRKSPRSD